MSNIVAPLVPLFKYRGYRKRAHAFNRTVTDGLIHVVSFQMGPYDPPGTVEIPGLRSNLYGTFTLNLGIFIPDVADHKGAEVRDSKKFIPEYQCHIRSRIGSLLTERTDTWWELDQPTRSSLTSFAERFSTMGSPGSVSSSRMIKLSSGSRAYLIRQATLVS